MSGMCLEGASKVSGRCLEGVWKLSERCLDGVWMVSGRCLEGVWKVSERCLEGVGRFHFSMKKISSGQDYDIVVKFFFVGLDFFLSNLKIEIWTRLDFLFPIEK